MPGGWNHDEVGIGRANNMPVTAVDHSQGPKRGSIDINWIDKQNGDKEVFSSVSAMEGRLGPANSSQQ